jgi:hypothetical protein
MNKAFHILAVFVALQLHKILFLVPVLKLTKYVTVHKKFSAS